MKIIKYISSLITISLLITCTKPYTIDFNDIDKRIVVNSFFFPDSLMKFHLSEEASLIDGANLDFKIIDKAKIIIYGDNKIIDTATNIGDGNYYSDFKPQENIRYKIEINAQGYDKVTAEDQIPTIVPIDTIQIMENSHDFYSYKVKIIFDDPGNEENYYFLYAAWKMIDQNENYIWWSEAYIKTEDPAIGVWNSFSFRVPIFSDELFNGKKYGLTFDLDYPSYIKYNSNSCYFDLRSISKSMYLYLKSYNQQTPKYGDDLMEYFKPGLMEPIPIYTNVEGGLGIFAGYAIAQDSVYFE